MRSDGDRRRFLVAATAAQLLVFYSPTGSRALALEPTVLASVVLLRHLSLPILGHDITMALGGLLYSYARTGEKLWLAGTAGALGLAAVFAFALRYWRSSAAWFAVPGLCLAIAGYVGAIHSGPGLLDVEASMRYAFAPQVLLSFALLALAAGTRAKLARYATIWIAALGLVSYFRPLDDIANGPDWREQVSQWKAIPSTGLRSGRRVGARSTFLRPKAPARAARRRRTRRIIATKAGNGARQTWRGAPSATPADAVERRRSRANGGPSALSPG